MMKNATSTIVLVLIALTALGCVERTISITTQPPGALVYLNDKEVGRTPLTTPFLWNGVYDVRIEADGHTPLWTKADTGQPLWDAPGIDLIAEMVPGGKRQVQWHFELDPAVEADSNDLIERAVELKHRVVQDAPDGATEDAPDVAEDSIEEKVDEAAEDAAAP